MAKIKQIKMRLELDPNRPNKEIIISVNYNATDRHTETYRRPVPPDNERFWIKLPQVIADVLGVDKATAGGQDEVVVKFKELVEQYKRIETEVNQVILYKIDVDPKPGAEKNQFNSGFHKISVWAGTYEETIAIAGDGSKRYSYVRVESLVNFSLDGKDSYNQTNRNTTNRFNHQVPWNDLNAAFFIWIKENMELLIKSLHELEQPDKLIESINAGRLLPLGGHGVD